MALWGILAVFFILIFLGMLSFHTWVVKTTVCRLQKPHSPACTIVHISDLHGRTRFWNGRISRLINRWQPDLVCVTGDLTSRSEQLTHVLNELGRIESRFGLFFVPGNYEREERRFLRKRKFATAEYEQLREAWLSRMTVLENAAAFVQIDGRPVMLYGFDNSIYGNERNNVPDQSAFMDHSNGTAESANPAPLTVFLAHSPRIQRFIRQEGLAYDLLLCGHTHGGQVRLFGKTWGVYRDVYTGAKTDSDGSVFYVTRGLGTVKLPFRWNCFPEITVFYISPVADKSGVEKHSEMQEFS
ncbi:metallophosphoesterase [Brevibacillus borstelensis]|uniref:metallophosphoesterase n=1 Tax=Brevibacillus borstelensis TaxID=45462 RepID=UPI0009DDD44B|nr:metallophosphoesterase [Brevibacillus borstelensis]MCM3557163.1 metallophosphoesterase [Brevibacillus borstelensis]MCM3590845.1 metallophosphoesterase [Brevibacillus borstelensis]MED1853275.1 metallophosphoesterase [Brevibacillus borstelensis]